MPQNIKVVSHKSVYTNMYSNFIPHTLTLEAAQIPCKLCFVRTVLLLGDEKGQAPDADKHQNESPDRQDGDHQPLNAMHA